MSITSGTVHTAVVSAEKQLAYLERLSGALEVRGLRTHVTYAPGRPPRLHVLNPSVSALTEDIEVQFAIDGWWFLWSWAERICSAEDIKGAADGVERVLYV